jgi:hypothetical protein
VSGGNDGPAAGSITIPADARGVIAIGAVDKSGRIADFSSRGPTDAPELTGPKPNVVAPGVAITSCRSRHAESDGPSDQGEYITFSGTSMACPHVSGALAALLSFAREVGVELAAEALAAILIGAVIALKEEDSPAYGKGLINVPRALSSIDEMRSPQRQVERAAPARPTSVRFEPIKRTPEMAAALETQSTAAPTSFSPVTCGGCGKMIVTQLDIVSSCAESGCGRPICARCWRAAPVPGCGRHKGVRMP